MSDVSGDDLKHVTNLDCMDVLRGGALPLRRVAPIPMGASELAKSQAVEWDANDRSAVVLDEN